MSAILGAARAYILAHDAFWGPNPDQTKAQREEAHLVWCVAFDQLVDEATVPRPGDSGDDDRIRGAAIYLIATRARIDRKFDPEDDSGLTDEETEQLFEEAGFAANLFNAATEKLRSLVPGAKVTPISVARVMRELREETDRGRLS